MPAPWNPVPGWDVPHDYYEPDEPTGEEESFNAMVEEMAAMEVDPNWDEKHPTDRDPPERGVVTAYIRSTDGAEMIEVAPHQYVNRAVLRALGMHI